jgi:hypothetical protein
LICSNYLNINSHQHQSGNIHLGRRKFKLLGSAVVIGSSIKEEAICPTQSFG